MSVLESSPVRPSKVIRLKVDQNVVDKMDGQFVSHFEMVRLQEVPQRFIYSDITKIGERSILQSLIRERILFDSKVFHLMDKNEKI